MMDTNSKDTHFIKIKLTKKHPVQQAHKALQFTSKQFTHFPKEKNTRFKANHRKQSTKVIITLYTVA